MAVTINYIGGFGNTIFQYVRGRLLAEKNNTVMLSPFPYEEIIKTNFKPPKIKLPMLFLPRFHVTDKNINTLSKLNKFFNYSLSGFFQDTHIINECYLNVFNFFKLPAFVPKPKDEVVMHIRLGDFYHDDYLSSVHNGMSEIIHPEYYLEILNNINFSKLNIVVFDNPRFRNLTEHYLTYFRVFQPKIIMNNTIKEDFHFIRKFSKIISSNSTFSWWASFFSNAENIFIPAQTGYFGIGSNLKPHGTHIQDLWNIRNISTPVSCKFCDIKKI
jgi:hypothetical protein